MTTRDAAEACTRLGYSQRALRQRNESGMKRIDYMFSKAQALARHDVLCYVNCDIILMDDFIRAVERVKTAYARF